MAYLKGRTPTDTHTSLFIMLFYGTIRIITFIWGYARSLNPLRTCPV